MFPQQLPHTDLYSMSNCDCCWKYYSNIWRRITWHRLSAV